MNKLQSEMYWDVKKQMVYTKSESAKVGPQHEKVVILTPHEQEGDKQQFTTDFFELLVFKKEFQNIKTLKELNEKLNQQRV